VCPRAGRSRGSKHHVTSGSDRLEAPISCLPGRRCLGGRRARVSVSSRCPSRPSGGRGVMHGAPCPLSVAMGLEARGASSGRCCPCAQCQVRSRKRRRKPKAKCGRGRRVAPRPTPHRPPRAASRSREAKGGRGRGGGGQQAKRGGRSVRSARRAQHKDSKTKLCQRSKKEAKIQNPRPKG
jgi:hypothetical protein